MDPAPFLRQLARLACALAVAHALWGAARAGWTYDEAFHLRWSERLAFEGEDTRDDHARYNSKTPVSIPNAVAQRAARAAGLASETQRFVARLPTVALLAALLWAVGALARRLGGELAGPLARLFAALDPNLIAHGSLATVDVAYALAVLLCALAFLPVAERPGLRRAALLGAALGAALAIKFTALLLLPFALTLPGFAARPGPGLRGWLRLFAMAALVAVLVIDASYLFTGLARPLGDHAWRGPLFTALATALPGLRLPVPEAFLTGLDASLVDEGAGWIVVLLGREWPGGVWFYFLVLALLKTPLAASVGQGLGLWRLLRGPGARASAVRAVLLVLALHALYFSFLFRAQIGYRFALACVPLVAALAAAGLAPGLHGRRARPALLLLFALGAAELLPFAGNPLAFTNSLVWPKREAFRYVADSNLDWGQGRERLPALLAAEQLATAPVNPVHPLPGPNVVGINELTGVFGRERFRLLRERLSPLRHFEHTALLFELPEPLFDRYMGESRSVIAAATDAASCESAGFDRITHRDYLPLVRRENPPPGRTWLLCVRSGRGNDIAVRAETGNLHYGRYLAGRGCVGDFVRQGQEAVWRVGPGTTALCLEEQSNRRAYIEYRLDARFRPRLRPVQMALVGPIESGAAGRPQE